MHIVPVPVPIMPKKSSQAEKKSADRKMNGSKGIQKADDSSEMQTKVVLPHR